MRTLKYLWNCCSLAEKVMSVVMIVTYSLGTATAIYLIWDILK